MARKRAKNKQIRNTAKANRAHNFGVKRGVVKRLDKKCDHAWIFCEYGERKVFLHISQVEKSDLKWADIVGKTVSFMIAKGYKENTNQAVKIVLLQK